MGRNKIDNANTNGFDKNPQNINRKGSPPSLKKQLIKLLEVDGKMTFKWNQVVKFEEGIEVTIKLPTEILLMQKLMSHGMSNGNTSLKAIEMIMSYIDGKPKQEIGLELTDIVIKGITFDE